MFRLELGETFAGVDVRARGGEPREDFPLRREQETRAFTDAEAEVEGEAGAGVVF